jgi:hypothetical protein
VTARKHATDAEAREMDNLLRAWDQASWAARRKFLVRVAQIAELIAFSARQASDDQAAP